MSSRRAKAVLFDLDGTLVDTADDLVEALNRSLDEAGQARQCADALRPHASSGSRGLLAAALKLTPQDAEFRPWQLRFLAHYENCLSEQSHCYPGIAELLQHLEQRGIPWGIATNKPIAMAHKLNEDLGLKPAALVGSGSVPRIKPAADMLELACAYMRVSPADVVYIGDAQRDIEAARAAGMPSIACRYGYVLPDEDVDSWQADHICKQPIQLTTLLNTHFLN